jgi:hypothetical protein
MQPQNLRKPRWSYLFFRCYCLAVLLFWNGYGLYELLTDRLEPSFTYLEPLVIPAILLCLNLLAFPFKYSVFGAFKRTPWPDEPPLCSRRSSEGRIFLMRGGFKWYAFSSGLGFRIFGFVKGFIPYCHINSVRKRSRWCVLDHSWPEVRRTVWISDKEICALVSSRAGVVSDGDRRDCG